MNKIDSVQTESAKKPTTLLFGNSKIDGKQSDSLSLISESNVSGGFPAPKKSDTAASDGKSLQNLNLFTKDAAKPPTIQVNVPKINVSPLGMTPQ